MDSTRTNASTTTIITSPTIQQVESANTDGLLQRK